MVDEEIKVAPFVLGRKKRKEHQTKNSSEVTQVEFGTLQPSMFLDSSVASRQQTFAAEFNQ